jgi:hydroxymethylbilane synthase
MATRALLRIGTRGSRLALVQAHLVRDRLIAAHQTLAEPGAIEVAVIKTTGDRVQDRTLADIGGKGLFTKEIEEALIDRRIDLAVHSMKDVPTWLPPGLEIACVLPREDPRDAFIGRGADGLAALPRGAVVGTASLRRQAQVLNRRPDVRVMPLRGNVETRLRKLAAGDCDATLLAMAGLRRLGMADRATAALDPAELLPAVAQGAIGIEIRADDSATVDWLAPLDHRSTAMQVAAERAMLAVLDGSCRTPIAGFAELLADDAVHLRALVARPDGTAVWRATRRAAAADAERLGADAGHELKAAADPAIFGAGA